MTPKHRAPPQVDIDTESVLKQLSRALGPLDKSMQQLVREELPGLRLIAEAQQSTRPGASATETIKALRPLVGALDRIISALSCGAQDGVTRDRIGVEAMIMRMMRWQIAMKLDPKNPDTAIYRVRANTRVEFWLETLKEIQDCATQALGEAMNQKKAGRGGRRHVEDPAFEPVAHALFDLYRDLTGKDPAVTEDGRTVRFLDVLLPILGFHVQGPEALRTAIQAAKPTWRYRD